MADLLNPPDGVGNIPATEMPAGVLFDMDGTLIDSEPLWMAAETALVASFGGIWTHDDGVAMVGLSLPKSAKIMREKAKLPISEDEILSYLLGSVTNAARANMPWRPGAEKLLSDLKAAGVPCALVTASYRSFADIVMKAANGALTAVVPGDEVTHGKPDPESYLTAARKIGVPVTQCVAIEDSETGVTSALASGARTIGIPAVMPLAPRPGLSRFDSLTDLNLAILARIAKGEVIDRSDG
ncbi:MAG: HAD family phosphatase [Promicromonosporaceae bacterium]|nr:HAD family phosphatase [Promicromonosporaceae bacterium]